MAAICSISNKSFSIQKHGKNICNILNIPEPEISMEESMRRTLSYRNTLHLFKRKCDLTGKNIISNYPANSKFKVYDKDEWFSDQWDSLSLGLNYNKDRSFFEQFFILQQLVPALSLENQKTENADYCNIVVGIKDSYLAFRAHSECIDIYSSYNTRASKDVYYSLYTVKSEKCIYGIHNKFCYDTIGCEYCFNSNSCYFCYSLEGCSDCIFSSNLKNKQFYLFNKQVSKEEYFEFKSKLDFGDKNVLKKAFGELKSLRLKSVSRAAYLINCENCIGNELTRCANAYNCFNGSEAENLEDCISFAGGDNNFRCFGFSTGCSFNYECHRIRNAQNCAFLLNCFDVYQCQYCINMYNCKDCFGCVGLRNKQYCILNKQYNKDDYEKLLKTIISNMKKTPIKDSSFKHQSMEYGNFFPAENSYFEYNLSASQMYYPLAKQAILERGYSWFEFEESETKSFEVSPQHVKDFKSEMKIFRSETTGKSFNLLPHMIRKLQDYNIYPIQEHPIEYLERRTAETSYHIIERQSSKSKIMLKTTFTDEFAPKIYSDIEYQQEFY